MTVKRTATSRLSRALGLMMLIFSACTAGRTEAADAIAVNDEVRQLLNRYVPTEHHAGIAWALGRVDQTTLGPQPLDAEEKAKLRGPEREVRLKIADNVRGEGTEDAPYHGAVRAFLETLDDDQTDVTVVVPPGRYQEIGLNLPAGLWLRAEAGATLVAPASVGEDEPRYLVSPNRDGAVIGFEIDGSAATERIDAIQVAGSGDRAIVAHNHIHHLTGQGVRAAGGGRRGASDVWVVANRMEYLGYSGVRLGNGWTAEHNDVRYAGILRRGGMGGGGDGLITHAHVRNARILNNHIVTSRRPDPKEVFGMTEAEWEGKKIKNSARHGLATQKSEHIIMRGNLVVARNGVRMAVSLADESNRNHVVGNVFLQLLAPGAEGSTWICIVANGAENRIAGNAILGFENAFNINEPKRPERIHGNVTEFNYVRTIGKAVRVTGPNNPIRNNRIAERLDYDAIIRQRLAP